MLSAILYGVITLLSLTGLLAILYYVAFRILHSRDNTNCVVVIPADETNRDVATTVYAAKLRVGMLGSASTLRFAVLDLGMTELERIRCESLSRESADIAVCTAETLLTQLSKQDT